MIFNVNFWIVVFVCLCVLEIFIGGFISLAFGLSALLMAGFLFLQPDLIGNGYVILLLYAILGLISSTCLWYFFAKKSKGVDINE